MFKKLALVLVVFVCLGNSEAFAQEYFGQNKMAYEKLDKYTETDHFMIYHSLDLEDPYQKKHFEEQVLNPLENSYRYFSSVFNHNLKHKIPVMVYKSHSGFEGNYVIDGPFYKDCEVRKKTWRSITGGQAAIYFLPEGVGAFAEPTRNRIVLKLDFLPPLNATMIAHELGHIFQYDMLGGILGRLVNMIQLPSWFIEGGADYWADQYNPYTRDDIRKMNQRMAAGNPEKYLPTWEELNSDQGDAYSMGAMVFKFVRDKFGEDIVKDFYLAKLKNKKRGNLLQILGEAINKKNDPVKPAMQSGQTNGKQNKNKLEMSPHTFDRLHREYWADKYAMDSRVRPTPHSDNSNFKSWSVVPDYFPYPAVSAVPSCDGKTIFAISVKKSNISVVSFKAKENADEVLTDPDDNKVENITPFFPPKPLEYVVAQELNVWPFNGSDLTVSCDGKKVAVFGRVGRDHALTIWDVEKRELVETIEIPFDQAFSPFFSTDGKKVYFSASKNVTRNVYVVDLETRDIRNITGNGNFDAFDTAPAVSHDGTRLAYVSFDGDFQKLFLMDLATGQHEQLTFGRFNDNSPSWSEDDKTLVYTSDEEAGIWNVHTLDLETRTVSQRTNLFGGAFTPKYVPGNPGQIYYVAYQQYDQYRTFIYPNFEVFRAELRAPVNSYQVQNTRPNMDFAFRVDDLFQIQADKNQLLNGKKPPEKFKLYGRSVSFGYSPYFGGFGGTSVAISNLLENQHYFIRALSYGDFKIFDGAYLNQKNRLSWGYASYYQKLPIRYGYWQFDFRGSKYPAQFILNQTWTTQYGVDLFTNYPLNKFKRLEGGIRFKNRSYLSEYGLTSEVVQDPEFADLFTPADIELFNLYGKSTGSSVSLVGAYVIDTGVDAYPVWGALNGNRIRAQIEYAPRTNNRLLSYTTLSIDARKYICLGQCQSSLLAVRGKTSFSSNPTSGEIELSEIDQLRGYPYGSYIGNQFVYGSAELRFPLGVLGVNGLGYMPLRGILFGDVGYSRFSGQKYPGQSGMSVGAIIQFPLFGMPFNYGISWTDKDGFKDRKAVAYFGFGF